MKSYLFAFVVLASSVAAADSIGIPLSSGLSLADGRIVKTERADLIASELKLTAPRGIRREGGQTGFEQSAPILLDEPYVVRDVKGQQHRVRVKALVKDILWVINEPMALEEAAPVAANISGVFRVASWTIDGLPTASVYPSLELRDDGTFRMGGAQGRWSRGDRTIHLEGHYKQWGPATISSAGQSVAFQFSRGPLQYRIVMERVSGAPELTASASTPGL